MVVLWRAVRRGAGFLGRLVSRFVGSRFAFQACVALLLRVSHVALAIDEVWACGPETSAPWSGGRLGASTDPKLMKKTCILEDATRLVPASLLDPLPPALDFPHIADRTLVELKAAGMNIVTATDLIA